MTVYTVATDTFWTLSTGQGTDDGSSFANRTQVPADITGISITSDAILYIVRETASLTRTATGTIEVDRWITITGDAVSGVYPDATGTTFELILDDCGQIDLKRGNISYILFGMSDSAQTVSRTAATKTNLGEFNVNNNSNTQMKLFMYKCEVGMASGHYHVQPMGGVYFHECILKKSDATHWFNAAATLTLQNSAQGILVVENTVWTGGSLFFFNNPLEPQMILVGTLAANGVSTTGQFEDTIRCRRVFPVYKDGDSTVLEDVYVSLNYTGTDKNKDKIPSDFWTKRKTDAEGRPEVPDGSFAGGFDFTTSEVRNEMRCFFVPFSFGSYDDVYVEDGTYDPAMAITAYKGIGFVGDTTTNAMATDYGSAASPTTITLASNKRIKLIDDEGTGAASQTFKVTGLAGFSSTISANTITCGGNATTHAEIIPSSGTFTEETITITSALAEGAKDVIIDSETFSSVYTVFPTISLTNIAGHGLATDTTDITGTGFTAGAITANSITVGGNATTHAEITVAANGSFSAETLTLPTLTVGQKDLIIQSETFSNAYQVIAPANLPVVSAVSTTDYAITELESTTVTATITNTPLSAYVTINNKVFGMGNTTGNTWSTGVIFGSRIGVCSTETITVRAGNENGSDTDTDSGGTMTVTAASLTGTDITLYGLKEEIVIFLRNQDIISISDRGVTTQTDTGTYAADVTDTLDTSPTLVKNVRSIIVGGTTLTFGTDYSVNYETGVITYTGAQTGAYTISYDTGSTDRIFPDYPQPSTKLSKFPRIAVEIISAVTSQADVGATMTLHEYNFEVVCYSANSEELEDMVSAVTNKLIAYNKSFYYSSFVRPAGLGPILNSPGKGDKILQRNLDFRSELNYKTK